MTAIRKAQRQSNDDLGIRPLTARSVLLSTLLGVDPPVLPASRLVATAALFGIEDGTARVALSRMAAAGEVEAADGRYRLAGRLLERQRHQLAARHPRPRPWRGDWRVAIVIAGGRPARARATLRDALLGGRLAAWRDGVWTRPDNLDAEPLPDEVARHVTWLVARPDTDPAALAAQLWDLAGWSRRATDLLDRLDASRPALDAGEASALASGFVLAAAVLRHLNADPLLPEALLPDGWPGRRLRRAYDDWDRAYQDVLASYHRDHP